MQTGNQPNSLEGWDCRNTTTKKRTIRSLTIRELKKKKQPAKMENRTIFQVGEDLLSLAHRYWYWLQLTTSIVWIFSTRVPGVVARVRRAILEMGLGILLLGSLLKPFCLMVWRSINLSTEDLTSESFRKIPTIVSQVWLTISILGVIGFLLLFLKLSERSPFKTYNRWGKTNGTGTEDCLSSRVNIEDHKEGNKSIINTSSIVAALSQQQVEEIFQKVLKEIKINTIEELDPDKTTMGESGALMDTNKKLEKDENLTTPKSKGGDEQISRLEEKIEELRKERNAEIGLFSNYLETIMDRLDYLNFLEGENEELLVDEKEMLRSGKELKEKKVTFIDQGSEEDKCQGNESREGTQQRAKDEVKIFSLEPGVEIFPMLIDGKDSDSRKRSRKGLNKLAEDVEMTETQQEVVKQARTLNELKESLKNVQQQVKEQREQLQRLTEEEKHMSKADLEKKWQEERFIKRFGERDEGLLTEDEKEMNKTQLYRKMMQERRDRWAKRQKELGIEVYQCANCGRYERIGSEHTCFRIPMKSPLRRRVGVPLHDQIVVESTKGGLSIKQQPIIDIELLKKEHASMTKTLEELEACNKLESLNEHKRREGDQKSVEIDKGDPTQIMLDRKNKLDQNF